MINPKPRETNSKQPHLKGTGPPLPEKEFLVWIRAKTFWYAKTKHQESGEKEKEIYLSKTAFAGDIVCYHELMS